MSVKLTQSSAVLELVARVLETQHLAVKPPQDPSGASQTNPDVDAILQQVVSFVAPRMPSRDCSVFLCWPGDSRCLTGALLIQLKEKQEQEARLREALKASGINMPPGSGSFFGGAGQNNVGYHPLWTCWGVGRDSLFGLVCLWACHACSSWPCRSWDQMDPEMLAKFLHAQQGRWVGSPV